MTPGRLSALEELEAGFAEVETELEVPIPQPLMARVHHELSGQFAVDTRLLIEEDGTPLCQISVPGDVFTITPRGCVWQDLRPTDRGPEIQAPGINLRVPIGAVVLGGSFLGGLLVGL